MISNNSYVTWKNNYKSIKIVKPLFLGKKVLILNQKQNLLCVLILMKKGRLKKQKPSFLTKKSWKDIKMEKYMLYHKFKFSKIKKLDNKTFDIIN